MMRWILPALLSLSICSPSAAAPQGKSERDLIPSVKACVGSETPARERDAACTDILESGLFDQDLQATAYAFRATAKIDLHDYAGSVRDFTEALEIEPNYYGYLDGRARAFGMMGEYQKAIQDLDYAIQIAPEAVTLYVNRATGYAEMGNYEAAQRDLTTARNLDPRHVDIYTVEGGIHVKRNEFDAAVTSFDQAIALQPNRGQLYLRRGYAQMLATNLADALSDFNRSIELGILSPDAFLYRGLAYDADRNPDDAFADYSATIDLDPTIAVAWYRRGLIHIDRQDFAMARDDLDVAAQIAPSADYLNALAWLLVAAEDQAFRDPEAALDYVEQSIALEENADNVDTAAAAQALLGNQEDAMRYYIRSMELGGAERVRMYQEYLADRGYYSGQPDGVDGPQTRAAIAAFAQEKRVLLVD